MTKDNALKTNNDRLGRGPTKEGQSRCLHKKNSEESKKYVSTDHFIIFTYVTNLSLHHNLTSCLSSSELINISTVLTLPHLAISMTDNKVAHSMSYSRYI